MDHAAIVKAGVSKRASAIQAELNHWIAKHISPADNAALGIALSRMAVSEYRPLYDKSEILAMIARIIDEWPVLDA